MTEVSVKMKLEHIDKLVESVQEAELVLVGLGEEWQVSVESMLEEETFKEDFKYFEKIGRIEEMLPVLFYRYYKKYIPNKLKEAYEILHNLLKDKNYFIVTTTLDSYLEQFGFKTDRIVQPCGNYRLLQCSKECEKTLVRASAMEENLQAVYEAAKNNDSKKCLCEKCGKEIVFNNIYADEYDEKGYLDNWNIYLKWLQGTVNRKIAVLELGVGIQFPTVIRWPFEKTVMYNQKSEFFRIHHNLAMLTAETAERGYTSMTDSVELICSCK